MRVLVTGGAGFIGSHLTDYLVSEKHEVVILDNFTRGHREYLAKSLSDVTVIDGDIRDRDALSQVMKGIDVVFHLAAQSNVVGAVKDIEYSFSTNVVGTFEVLRAASNAGVRRLVFSSSREVYGEAVKLPVGEKAPLNAKNAYGASKIAGELYCPIFRSEAFEVNVLRFANVYGPRDRGRVIPIFLDNAAAGTPFKIFGGGQLIDFVWIETVVATLCRAAFGPVLPGPVNVGSGKGTSLQKLAEEVIRITGTSSRIEIAPARSYETERFVADIAEGERLLSFTPPDDPLFGLSRMLTASIKA